jgi:glycosyltransferase involved in cell wall biosynthesis
VDDRSGLSRIHLVLVLDAGMSLAIWDQHGIFGRETELYRRLRPHLKAVTLVTHGDKQDLRLAERLPGIKVICNHRHLARRWYHWSVVLGLGVRLRLSMGRAVVKTNQMPGAGLPARLARFGGAKFLVRCGYRYADFMERLFGQGSFRAKEALELERCIYKMADMAVTTSEIDSKAVLAAYELQPERVTVIPNFVDTDLFHPSRRQKRGPVRRIALVGRLAPQKNPLAAIEALEGQDVELIVAGEGELKEEMAQLASRMNVRICFLGRVAHERLPALLADCDLYLQPSLYEGHPKSLLEAMACGLPVVAGDSPGISNVIEDGATGLLCGHDAASIRKAVLALSSQPELREALGYKARQWVLTHVSLDRVVDIEQRLLSSLCT